MAYVVQNHGGGGEQNPPKKFLREKPNSFFDDSVDLELE